ncbi:MAG: TetR/AcrR family transcriptional regulator [Polyangiales bacterium]
MPEKAPRRTKREPEATWPLREAPTGALAKKPRPTARGRRTEAALLDAARRVIARDGFRAASIAAICEEAGTSLGTFYTYFDSKERVLERLALAFKDEVQARYADVPSEGKSPYELMHALVRIYYEAFREHSPVLAGLLHASMHDPSIAAFWRTLRADARRQIAANVRYMQERGYAPGLDPEATASALGAMMDYFSYVWLVEGGEDGRPTIPDRLAVETMARIWFHSVCFREEDVPELSKKRGRR